jgi:hypothetical protein
MDTDKEKEEVPQMALIFAEQFQDYDLRSSAKSAGNKISVSSVSICGSKKV